MLAHVPSFKRNPRGAPDFLAYLVPKACMHVLGTGVPRRLGVARSASSPEAAQALGCSLTPGLRISFGRVACMARAASVPGLWTLGFLLLCGVCVWVWVVLGLGFWLRHANPGWADGVCVCLRARSACTPPLLAGVCGVGVCAWARVSAAPRHSWLGCWGLCVLVCPLLLYPTTPGWGVRCACVCSGSLFGCAPPLLAGVLGCVCACVRTPLLSRHSWLGCADWVCVLGLGFRLVPATPGWGVGVCVCSCARSACTPPLLAGVCGLCVCAWARVSAAPRHSWLGCWGVCVCVRAPRLYPAISGWGVRCVCVCYGSCFGCAPPLLAGCWGLCVFVCALRLNPATPGCGVLRGCVRLGSGLGFAPTLLAGVLGCACLCARSACTPPLLAGVCNPGVCAWARVSAAPRHSWLGCAVRVCVLGLGFRLRPATPGWGVAVCVFLCALRLYPAPPGWGVRCGRVCLGSGFGCAPPLLAGVCPVGVCAWARVSAPPRHSWLGCLGCCSVRVCVQAPLVPRHSWLGCAVWACVLGLRLWLGPSSPDWGVGVCVFVCALRLYPATPGWGVQCGCVCSGSGFGCAPPLLAGVLGFVCVCVRATLVPRHSWLGCAVWVCVLGLGFRLRPTTPGWAVRVCVCLCARAACTPPLLAWVCGVRVWCCLAPVPVKKVPTRTGPRCTPSACYPC